jgi:hypothetical protein
VGTRQSAADGRLPLHVYRDSLPKEGNGEGRMAVATKVLFDRKKNVVELEQYSAGTVRLNEITIEKK